MKSVLLINRRPHPGQFSIENIFQAIGGHLQKTGREITQYVSPRPSKGLLPRLYNAIHVMRHQKDANHIVGDVTYLAAFMRSRTLIVTIHDLNVYERSSGAVRALIGTFWYRLPMKKARFITTISEFTRKRIVDRFGINADRIRVIPNPIPEVFGFDGARAIQPEQTIEILQIGTKENKNLVRVLDALGEVASRYSIRLTVIGKLPEDGPSESDHQFEIINRFDLSLDEIVAHYRQAHLVVFASTYEGFGMPILEAQAVGRPVVTSAIEPMKTVSGGAAEFVDPYSVEDIARGVTALIENPARARDLVDQGCENARRYSVGSVSEQYAALYGQLL